jgi:trafficking protein particle complex subunit 2
MIVTRENDFPVYELELTAQLLKTNKAFQAQPMFQFILNAALDPVEQIQWQNPYYYLKCVDKYNESPNPQGQLLVHCFVTPSNSKFLLLHESKSEE